MNPSIARIIRRFEVEIEAQKLSAKIGMKEADLLAQQLADALKDFIRDMDIEKCENCFSYYADHYIESLGQYDYICPECRAETDAIDATNEMLKQVR